MMTLGALHLEFPNSSRKPLAPHSLPWATRAMHLAVLAFCILAWASFANAGSVQAPNGEDEVRVGTAAWLNMSGDK